MGRGFSKEQREFLQGIKCFQAINHSAEKGREKGLWVSLMQMWIRRFGSQSCYEGAQYGGKDLKLHQDVVIKKESKGTFMPLLVSSPVIWKY